MTDQISATQVGPSDVMSATRTVPDVREEWLAERKKGIGSSDVGVIMGCNKYKTPYQLWLEKTNQDGRKQKYSPRLDWGLQLEPYIADRYQELLIRRGSTVRVVEDPVIRVHPEYAFMLANIDRFLVGGTDGTEILEIKTTASFVEKSWEAEIPLSYYWQVQHQLFVTGLKKACVALLVTDKLDEDIKEIIIERNETHIKLMLEKCTEFWGLVETLKPPPLMVDDLSSMRPQENSSTDITENFVVREAIESCKRLKEKKKEIEEAIEHLQDKVIKVAFGTTEALKIDGEIIATWKSTRKSSIDKKGLEAYYPQIAKHFTTTSESRVLLFKEPKMSTKKRVN